MKTLRFFLCVSLILTACSIAPTTDNENFLVLTKSAYEVSSKYDVGKQQALSFIDTSGFSQCNILISKDVVAPNTETISVTDSYSPDYTSWLIFVDLHPRAYWAHECISYYVNTSTGEVISHNDRFPPSIPMDTLQCVDPVFSSSQRSTVYGNDKAQSRTMSDVDSTKWAVIMGGTYVYATNGSSINTECFEIYTMLCDTYSYSEDQIFVLYTDPSVQDFDYDNLPDKDYDFTKANVNVVFNTLSTMMSSGDTLSIFVMSHGDTIGVNKSAIVLWDGQEKFFDDELKAQVEKIPADIPITVIMGQCHSGGFIDDLFMKCDYIATSCAWNETAWPALYEDRSEFYRHWITAMSNFNADSVNTAIDSDANKIITFSEAFAYTNARYDENTAIQMGRYETRSEYSVSGYGEREGLSKIFPETVSVPEPEPEPEPEPLIPVISGPQIFKVGDNVTYTISDIPEDASVSWNYPSQLRKVSESSITNGRTITFCADGTDITSIGLTISATYTSSSGNGTKTIPNINIWKSGINISDNLIVGNLTPTGGTVQIVSSFEGASGYYWYSDQNWIVSSQGSYIAEFTNQLRDDNQYVTISVDFINPLGDQTTFVRTFTIN